jgi:hypothetical protein
MKSKSDAAKLNRTNQLNEISQNREIKSKHMLAGEAQSKTRWWSAIDVPFGHASRTTDRG